MISSFLLKQTPSYFRHHRSLYGVLCTPFRFGASNAYGVNTSYTTFLRRKMFTFHVKHIHRSMHMLDIAQCSFSTTIEIVRSKPFIFQLALCTGKTLLADYLAQKYIEGYDAIDWRRNIAFGVFGFLYLGAIQYGMYVNLYSKMFPGMERFANKTLRAKWRNKRGLQQLSKQVLVDVLLIGPFIYYPAFYLTKHCIQTCFPRSSVTSVSSTPNKYSDSFFTCVLQSAQIEYLEIFKGDLQMNSFLWIPLNIIVFSVPMWFRLPLRHIFSLLWTCWLSSCRGAPTGTDGEETSTKDSTEEIMFRPGFSFISNSDHLNVESTHV